MLNSLIAGNCVGGLGMLNRGDSSKWDEMSFPDLQYRIKDFFYYYRNFLSVLE